MRLENRVAIVTGAAGGIGQAMALAFAAEGASVVAADINEQEANATASSITDAGGDAIALRVDVTDADDAGQMVAATIKQYGQVDIIANVAGTGFRHSFLEAKAEDFERVMKVNLIGTFNTGQAAAREMVKRQYGRIINIASIAGNRAGAGRTAYGTSKSAVMGLTRQAALELGPLGITVNAVAPGPVDTAMTRVTHNEETRQGYARLIPAGRYGTVDEMADAAVFLAGEAAAYVNGLILFVDGGYTAAGISSDFAGYIDPKTKGRPLA